MCSDPQPLPYGKYLFYYPALNTSGFFEFTDPSITYCASLDAPGFLPNYYTNSLVPGQPYMGCAQLTTFTSNSLEGIAIFQNNACDAYLGRVGLGYYQTVLTAPGLYALVALSDPCPGRQRLIENSTGTFVPEQSEQLSRAHTGILVVCVQCMCT
eukprot:g56010.t1